MKQNEHQYAYFLDLSILTILNLSNQLFCPCFVVLLVGSTAAKHDAHTQHHTPAAHTAHGHGRGQRRRLPGGACQCG